MYCWSGGDLVPNRISAIPGLGASFPCRDWSELSSASDFHHSSPSCSLPSGGFGFLFPTAFTFFLSLNDSLRLIVCPEYLRLGPRSSLSAEARQKTLVGSPSLAISIDIPTSPFNHHHPLKMEDSPAISSGAADDVHSMTTGQDAPGDVVNASGRFFFFSLPLHPPLPLRGSGICQHPQSS